jgi:hypothetical protein
MTDSRIHPLKARAVRVVGVVGASAFGAASIALVAVACGRTADVEATDGGADGATGAPSATGMPAPGTGLDGSLNPLIDASTAPIDAGSPPVVACTDAGVMCASPPSDCLDEHTMRYFSGGTCNDAGTCDFTVVAMKCDPSPVPPDCYQGGCRVVIVR